MKTILMSLTCSLICLSLFAQVISTKNTSAMNSMNNNMNNSASVNYTNTPGQPDYAALPVLETYIPGNIVAEVKAEHEGSYIYDITAVKAPEDTSMAQGTLMNPSTPYSTTADSTATSTASQNSRPQQYDYVVRYLQGGNMDTEILNNDGSKKNQ